MDNLLKAQVAFLLAVVAVTQAIQLWAQCAAEDDISTRDLFDQVKRLMGDLEAAHTRVVLARQQLTEGGAEP